MFRSPAMLMPHESTVAHDKSLLPSYLPSPTTGKKLFLKVFSEEYWYHFHCPKNVLCSILSFVFWIFPPLDTAVQLESADSKQNTISKYLFQDSFRHIFWVMRKMHHTFWKKATFSSSHIITIFLIFMYQFQGPHRSTSTQLPVPRRSSRVWPNGLIAKCLICLPILQQLR